MKKKIATKRSKWWEGISTFVEIPFQHSSLQQYIFQFRFCHTLMRWSHRKQTWYYLARWYKESIFLALWGGWVQERVIPKNISGSERIKLALHTVGYHLWNLYQKEDTCGQLINKWCMFWQPEGQKGQVREATFFILYNILFVAKMLCVILYWNIANLTSFVAANGRR